MRIDIKGVGAYNFPDDLTEDQIVGIIDRDLMPKSWKIKEEVSGPYKAEPSFMARVGRGAVDVTDRISQLAINAGEKMGLSGYPEGLADAATQQMNDRQAQYQKDRPVGADGKPGFDAARLLGTAGIQAPMMLVPGGATALPRALSGATTGAVSGALTYDPTNTLAGGLTNTGLGAGIGAVAAPVVGALVDKAKPAISAIIGRVKGAAARLGGNSTPAAILQEVPELAALPPETRNSLIQEAQQQIKATGALNAEALARKGNLLDNGVTPTKSMVTRSPRDWTMERNLQKLAQSPDEQISSVGQELTGVYQANDKALTSKLAGMRKGLPQGSQESLGLTVMEKLGGLSKSSQKEVSEVYNQIRDTIGDELASDARNVHNVLTDPDVVDSAYSEGVLSSVTKRLRRYGLIDENGALTPKTLTVTQAEEFRKFLTNMAQGAEKKEMPFIQKFIKATDDDVLSGFGSQAFGDARAAARERFAMLGNQSTQKALGALGELEQGKTSQSFIRSQVLNGSEADVESLVSTIAKMPAGDKKAATDSLAAGVLDHLREKAVDRAGKFSGASLDDAVQKIGGRKLLAILGKERLAKLSSLVKAGIDATYQPPYSAVNNSNTAPMLLSLTQRARAIPGVPLLVSEEAQKMAAQSGYRGQLNTALAAGSKPQVSLPPALEKLLSASAAASPVTANAVLDQRRKKSNARK